MSVRKISSLIRDWMCNSIQSVLALSLLLCVNPGTAADVDNNTPKLLDCQSEHEGIRSHLELTESEATFTIRWPDGRSYVCKAKPELADGRKAVSPYYGASFSLGRCAPELPATVAGNLRTEVEYRKTIFDGKSMLSWIVQSAGIECAVKTNNFVKFFDGNKGH